MRLGLDFDNTLVCYDPVFPAVALERGLIPADLPATKDAVRDYLRRVGREDDWTELQGYVYGPRMSEAQPFPGALEFLRRCREEGVPVWIISHKTRYPFRGPQYDLHAAARQWMAERDLPADHVFLELTKQEKLARLGEVRCTHFVDDLPEFLAEPDFPAGVCRVLFDPHGQHQAERRFPRAASWAEVWELVQQ